MFCDNFDSVGALKWDLRVFDETFKDRIPMKREVCEEMVAPIEATLKFEEDIIRGTTERGTDDRQTE
jgi:hypothetical protein